MHCGNFILSATQAGQEFTTGDEAILALFASQGEMSIANARTHPTEQRARADLESLVDTSTVGGVVMEARTVTPVSFNREAKRIVEDLLTPGHSPEQLLENVTCRFADGREFPLAQELSNVTGVRAEEIGRQVSDGRSTTPIRSEDGKVESVVEVTKDLQLLEDGSLRVRTEMVRQGDLTISTHGQAALVTGPVQIVAEAPIGTWGWTDARKVISSILCPSSRIRRTRR